MLLPAAGGGVTQIVMPYLTEGIAHHVPTFQAWRYAFFFPGCLQIIWALMILFFGQVRLLPYMLCTAFRICLSVSIAACMTDSQTIPQDCCTSCH